MAKIAYIHAPKEKNILFLGIENQGESLKYTVNRAVYAEIGMPAVGDHITDEGLNTIALFDESYRAKKKALSLLAFADNNKRSLFQKLIRAGFSRSVAEECVEEMVALGYIDENRQLERLVVSEAKKMRGKKRILASLSAKGYKTKDILNAISNLEKAGELDFCDIEKAMLKKHLPNSEEKKTKLLYKHGFR